MKKLLLLILLLDLCFVGFSQKEDHKWILNSWNNDEPAPDENFGATVFDFNFLPPKIYEDPDINLDFQKSNTIISDENGEILFYSNAQSIHGNNHLPIINGDTINYDNDEWDVLVQFQLSTTYSITIGYRVPDRVNIIPIPSTDNQWYIFYQNRINFDITGFNELWHSKIEQPQNGEFIITEKDVVLNSTIGTFGKLPACRHANGRDWWMLQFNEETVYSYLISPTGISLENINELPFKSKHVIGQTNFSQDGTKFGS